MQQPFRYLLILSDRQGGCHHPHFTDGQTKVWVITRSVAMGKTLNSWSLHWKMNSYSHFCSNCSATIRHTGREATQLEQCLVRIDSPFFLTPPPSDQEGRLHQVTQLFPLKGHSSISWREFSSWMMADLLSLCLCLFFFFQLSEEGLDEMPPRANFLFLPSEIGSRLSVTLVAPIVFTDRDPHRLLFCLLQIWLERK